MDGQHRIEMSRRIVNNYSLFSADVINGTFRYCYKVVDNEVELIDLFKSVNKDSVKNEFYLNQKHFVQIKMDEFVNHMSSSYKTHFSTRKLSDDKRFQYTIPEFRDALQKYGFFENKKTVEQLVHEIILANDQYYTSIHYKSNIEHNSTNFYKNDLKQIHKGIIFTLVRNNFIAYLMDSSKPPIHQFKVHKKKITRQLKLRCWNEQYDGKEDMLCPIPNCGKNIKKHGDDWDAGHIISDKNGGACNLENLKPICKKCNQSMGSQNWEDYLSVI